jgi:hypothetical protein
MQPNCRSVLGRTIAPRKIARTLIVLLTVSLIELSPSLARACACGCGVFEVATPSLLPSGAGGMVWTEYDYMNQYINWHATKPASAGRNNDKKLATNRAMSWRGARAQPIRAQGSVGATSPPSWRS